MATVSLFLRYREKMTPFVLNKDLIDENEQEKIGSGAYGTITKIKYCGTPCAAKEIHPVLLPEVVRSSTAGAVSTSDYDTGKDVVDCVILENFLAEIKMLSEIRHPNFVQFIGVYFRESSPFPVLVMEHMFTSLAQCLKLHKSDKQKFPPQIRLLILQDVARAVAYLHSRNPPIVHRDLTVNNVLLTSNMSAKVADLGVAKIVDISYMSTICPGAMVYMAPETLKKHPQYGIEIDVYSYGVLGFHTFTGSWPLHHGVRKDDGSVLTDLERCHADLIDENHVFLKETFASCLHFDPQLRLKASEIRDKITEVVRRHKVQEHNFLDILYNEKHKSGLVIQMDQTITSQTEELRLKNEYIKKFMADKEKLCTDIQLLRSNNSGCTSTIRMLEKEKFALAQEVKRLHSTIHHQEKTIEVYSGLKHLEDPTAQLKDLIKAEEQINAHSQLCLTLECEKRDLSEEVRSLKALNLNISSEVRNKEMQLANKKRDLKVKKEEVELFTNKNKLLEEKVDILEKKLDRKSTSSEGDSTSLTASLNLEQYKKMVDLLKTVEELKRQNVEIEETHQMVQTRYRAILQELLIPHLVCCISIYNIVLILILQGILHNCSLCANLYMEQVDAVDLKPVGNMASTLHSIKRFPGNSMLEKNTSIVYNFQSSKIYFLSDLYLNGFSELFCGIALYYDPLSGRFDVIEGPQDERLCEILNICRLGDSIVALDKRNHFLLLADSKWVHSSIPLLPGGRMENPLILTYLSLLLVIDGNMMWVHDDGVCNWMKFQLSTSEGVLESSPKNCFVVLAGNLFICCSSQEMVYFVALQKVIDTITKSKCSDLDSTIETLQRKEVASNDSNHDVQILQLNVILKGANFIYRRGDDILAFHTTQSLVSSVYIDKAWYYSVNCCHWHNIECDDSDLTHGCWLSMAECAGIVEFSSTWSGWGHAKLSKVQLKKQKAKYS